VPAEVTEHAADPRSVLAALAKNQPTLQLATLDLCFLAALHLRAGGAALTSFGEEQLAEVFDSVCKLVEPGSEHLRRRATHAIQRLRDQKMLARVDGAGLLRAGEFSLTRLAASIVDSFLQDESLTRESLTLLTRSLRANLIEVRAAAERAELESDWQSAVEGPLRVTVSELVSGIERRQQSLDLEQQQFQSQIARLLESDWFGAVDRCLELLESTSRTLAELNEVLLRDAHELSSLLQDIQELAVAKRAFGAEASVQRVMEQVDRIGAWGAARQRAWSEYYQYVHRYLCDVVRLDPSRALIERLREQLSQHATRPFALAVAAAPAPRLLREFEPLQEERPKVSRPRAEREHQPANNDAPDPHAVVEERVQRALAAGASGLCEVTQRVAAETESAAQFLTAGRVAHAVAKLARTSQDRDRPWSVVQEGLVIEDWSIEKKREVPRD
jgi:chromosome partition protein MukF